MGTHNCGGCFVGIIGVRKTESTEREARGSGTRIGIGLLLAPLLFIGNGLGIYGIQSDEKEAGPGGKRRDEACIVVDGLKSPCKLMR